MNTADIDLLEQLHELPDFVTCDVSIFCQVAKMLEGQLDVLSTGRSNEIERKKALELAREYAGELEDLAPLFRFVLGYGPLPDTTYLHARSQAFVETLSEGERPSRHEQLEEMQAFVARFSPFLP
jgi:hypothetical protein